MRFISVCIAGFLGMHAQGGAQSWFTYEACTVTNPSIDERAIDAAMMDKIKAEAATLENGVGRLWKITAPSGAVSHLWGTMHATSSLILDLPKQLEAIITNARVVMPEISPIVEDRSEVTSFMRGDGMWAWDGDAIIHDALDPRILPWIDQRFRALGFPEDALEMRSPAGILSPLLAHPCDDFSLWRVPIQDDRIAMLGRQAGAAIIGLEPHDLLLNLNQDAYQDTARALIELYASWLGPHNVHARENTVYALYLQGRLAEWMAWDRIHQSEFFGDTRGAEISELSDSYLLWNRNLGFVRNATRELDQGGALLAVGGFHLPGRRGMISLLRKSGFTVERIPVTGEIP